MSHKSSGKTRLACQYWCSEFLEKKHLGIPLAVNWATHYQHLCNDVKTNIWVKYPRSQNPQNHLLSKAAMDSLQVTIDALVEPDDAQPDSTQECNVPTAFGEEPQMKRHCTANPHPDISFLEAEGWEISDYDGKFLQGIYNVFLRIRTINYP